MTPQTYADLAHENMHLLAALWRLNWFWSTFYNSGEWSTEWTCHGCLCHAEEKHLVRHAPGCALFGVDPALLAQMDAFDAMPEKV